MRAALLVPLLALAMYLGTPVWVVATWAWGYVAGGLFNAALRDPKTRGAPWAWAVVAITWPIWTPYVVLEHVLNRALRRLD